MIRALIFDYFGVIRPLDNGLRAAYRRLGGNVAADESFIADVTTAGNLGFIDDANEQIAAKLGISLQQWLKEIGNRNNDPELVAYIAKVRGAYKTGLLSNAGAHMASTMFRPKEIHTLFDVVLLSGDVGMAKPEAAFYRLIAQKLDVIPQDCVMIDDRAEYCDGARRIGMQAIEYHHFDQFLQDLQTLKKSHKT